MTTRFRSQLNAIQQATDVEKKKNELRKLLLKPELANAPAAELKAIEEELGPETIMLGFRSQKITRHLHNYFKPYSQKRRDQQRQPGEDEEISRIMYRSLMRLIYNAPPAEKRRYFEPFARTGGGGKRRLLNAYKIVPLFRHESDTSIRNEMFDFIKSVDITLLAGVLYDPRMKADIRKLYLESLTNDAEKKKIENSLGNRKEEWFAVGRTDVNGRKVRNKRRLQLDASRPQARRGRGARRRTGPTQQPQNMLNVSNIEVTNEERALYQQLLNSVQDPNPNAAAMYETMPNEQQAEVNDMLNVLHQNRLRSEAAMHEGAALARAARNKNKNNNSVQSFANQVRALGRVDTGPNAHGVRIFTSQAAFQKAFEDLVVPQAPVKIKKRRGRPKQKTNEQRVADLEKKKTSTAKRRVRAWCGRNMAVDGTYATKTFFDQSNDSAITNVMKNLRKPRGNFFWMTTDGKGIAAAWLLNENHPELQGKKILYVRLICTETSRADQPKPGNGRKLLLSMIAYAKREHLDAVWLASVPTAIGFYKKLGFDFGPGRLKLPIVKATATEFVKNKALWKNQRPKFKNLPDTFYRVQLLGGNGSPNHRDGPLNGYFMSLNIS